MRSARTWRIIVGLAALAPAAGAWAQQVAGAGGGRDPAAARIEKLEATVERLSDQLRQVQKELAQLKAARAAEEKRAAVEELRREAAEAARAAAPAGGGVDTTTRFVSGTRMQPQTNPEISFTGNSFLVGGNHQREEMQGGEFELDAQSYLDPYTKMHLVVSHSLPEHGSSFGLPEGADTYREGETDVEEGYITWLGLPGSTTLTVGKERQQFGVLNRWHAHALDQVDYPWVLQESFGEEGLTGTGVSVDWLMPHLWATANELTVEVTDGDNDTAFAGTDWRHPSFLVRLKNYWDLTPDSYLEIGLDALHGKADAAGHLKHDFYALDWTYDWYPAGRAMYRELTLRGMLLRSERERIGLPERDAWGGYVYGQMKFSPHWIAGLRYDRVDDQLEEGHRYWGLSPYLTFWESEFVRLRGQASYRKDDRFGIDRRFVLQVTFAAGPHKHERY